MSDVLVQSNPGQNVVMKMVMDWCLDQGIEPPRANFTNRLPQAWATSSATNAARSSEGKKPGWTHKKETSTSVQSTQLRMAEGSGAGLVTNQFQAPEAEEADVGAILGQLSASSNPWPWKVNVVGRIVPAPSKTPPHL